jgi:hypothetical protein
MKAKVRIALHQANMRSRLKRRIATNAKLRSEKTPSAGDNELQRRVAGTILAARGWSAQDLSIHFGWNIQDVKAWLAAGKPLL